LVSGPFPTEDFGNDGDVITQSWKRIRISNRKKRRCGWLDLVALKYAVQVNRLQLMMMKGDVLSGFEKKLKVCTNNIKEKPFSIYHTILRKKCNQFTKNLKVGKQGARHVNLR
jgi:adenylosuccinate synthase